MKVLAGLILATLGGGIQGAFVYPLKFMKNWRWENGWFIFTVANCLIIPTVLTFATTPDLLDIYRDTETTTLWLVFVSGVAWGIGVVLFGLGADYLGMALGIAIITALNAAFGTLLPILFLPTGSFSSIAFLILVFGLAVLVPRVIQVSAAGKLREKEQEGQEVKRMMKKVSFRIGLVVCLVAATIMTANILGVMSGEWEGVSRKAFVKLYSGIGILILAIVIVSLSNIF